MKKSIKLRVLASLMLGTTIMFSAAVCPVFAENYDNAVMSSWNSREELTQEEKTAYNKGDLVIYDSAIYQCKRTHYSQPGWNPKAAPMFWKFIKEIPQWKAEEELTQSQKTAYNKGDLVMHDSKIYKCKRFHYAQPGWNPSAAPMFWQLIK